MLFYALYWFLGPILWLLLFIISLLNDKVRHHLLYQKKTWASAEKKIISNGYNKTPVLFHASSTGEFEQLKPVLNKVDRNNFFILQTFFSPTPLKNDINTTYFDAFCYHPFDFIWSAWFFLRKMKIQYYITTRNDLWPNHLFIANQLGIQTVLINANLYRPYQYNSIFYRKFNRVIFEQFNIILTGSDRLKKNLHNLVPNGNIKITGDSRVDRVIERKENNKPSILPDIYKTSQTLILGSIIPSDYSILLSGLKKYYPKGQSSIQSKNQCLIIVPHEIISSQINRITKELTKLDFEWVFYSQKDNKSNCPVIIIDEVGILADLYIYSDLAYIGAGFGAGVHSVIEPAIYGNAISFGPNFQIVDMAVQLASSSLASIIKTDEDFIKFLNLFDNHDQFKKITKSVKEFIATQQPASNKIIQAIFHDS